MSTRALVLVALFAGAAGFLLHSLLSGTSEADLGPTNPDRLRVVIAQNEALRRENAALEAERPRRTATDAARGAAAAAVPGGVADGGETAAGSPDHPGAAAGAAAGDAPGTTPAAGRRFFTEEYGGALGHVDWKMVGGNLREMVGVLQRGLPILMRGEKIPPAFGRRIQELNSPVLGATIQVRDHLPGSGVNGKFTSAPFMVNAIAAALEAADLPLDDRQAGKIDAIARDTMAKDERRLAGYGDGTFALQRILDEAELKGAFFRDVFAVLSEAQATALSPASVRNRVRLDLFSSAMVFGPHIDAFTFRDEEELATRLRDRVAKSLKFTDDQRTALDPVVRRWAAACPRDLLFMTWGVLDERGMVTAARAEAWGREFLKLFTTLAGEPGLSAPQRAAFRGVGNILVPLNVDRRES